MQKKKKKKERGRNEETKKRTSCMGGDGVGGGCSAILKHRSIDTFSNANKKPLRQKNKASAKKKESGKKRGKNGKEQNVVRVTVAGAKGGHVCR